MKIKNLKIFKSIAEKRENMKLQVRNNVMTTIKKEWTKEELESAKAQYIFGVAYSKYKFEEYTYTPQTMNCYLTEDFLKRYLLNTNRKYFTREEYENLMKEINVQASKKLIK